MVYILPGSNYKEADLHEIHEGALHEADVALLADAWEASSCPGILVTVSIIPHTSFATARVCLQKCTCGKCCLPASRPT